MLKYFLLLFFLLLSWIICTEQTLLLHNMVYVLEQGKGTCVSSRHSQKGVTFLKLRTKLKINFSLFGPIFPNIFSWGNINFYISWDIWDFDLIPTVKDEYHISADIHCYKDGTKLPHESPIYLVWSRFFLINHCWLCIAVVIHAQPLSKWLRRNAIKHSNRLKIAFFWPLQNFSTCQVCYEVPKIHN